MLACGLTAGIVSLIALLHHRERSLFVWLTLVVGVGTIAFRVGEFLVLH
ncbi:MAG: hypothetical protein ACYDH4_03835 [Candidatus Cryosericum sp.]